jgi:serine O-acetyltransferase
MKMSELLDEDWKRLCEFSGQPDRPRRWYHGLSPRFATVYLLRTAHSLHGTPFAALSKLLSLVNFVVFGIEVPARLSIGAGLVIPHTQGTVIGAGYIGENVTIYQQVTLGAKLADNDYDISKRPYVEDGVTITAGAKVLGPVRLGANCIIGANAVVISDVPAGATAVGVPARIVKVAAV